MVNVKAHSKSTHLLYVGIDEFTYAIIAEDREMMTDN